MKRFLLFSLLFIGLIFPSFSQTTIEQNIFFDSDSHVLDASSENALVALMHEVGNFQESNIHIVGHTDQDGNDTYNMELSKKRAESVKEFIANEGFDSDQIQLSFRGESELLHKNTDAKSKQENRRVAVILEGYSYHTVDEMVAHLNVNQPDQRTIHPTQSDQLELSRGTEVKIPSEAFCHMDGSPVSSSPIEMVFKEAFTYTEMVDERLFTQTADALLETGGMIYIEAIQDGQPLRLRDGKEIELIFPEQETKDGMELFSGVEDEDGVLWEETGESIEQIEGEKEEWYLEVDLSPLSNHVFENIEIPDLSSLRDMPKYPREVREPYPPYEGIYSKDKYQEVYDKYLAQKKLFDADQLDLPERRKKWHDEVHERKVLLREHKIRSIEEKIQKRLRHSLTLMNAKKDEQSHHILVNNLFGFLSRNLGAFPYNDKSMLKKVFGNALRDVREQTKLRTSNHEEMKVNIFAKTFNNDLYEVKQNIVAKKIELGYIDQEVLNRYVATTPRLGWINCDRFLRMEASQQTELEFVMDDSDCQYYLVFKNIRSLMRPIKRGGIVVFKNLPKGEPVRIVAVQLENQTPRIASQDFVLTSENQINLTFKEGKIEDVRKKLEEG